MELFTEDLIPKYTPNEILGVDEQIPSGQKIVNPQIIGGSVSNTTIQNTTIIKTAPVVINLIDGATIPLNSALGDIFLVTTSGDRTIGIPTNPVTGKPIIIVHKASGADRTLSLNASGFRFGTTITALTATTSAKTDYIGCIYNQADNIWDVIAYVKGY